MEAAINSVGRNFGRIFGRQMLGRESLHALLDKALINSP
jgi:hypothetical protein